MPPPKRSPPPFPPLLSNSPLHPPMEQHFGCPSPSTIHSFDPIESSASVDLAGLRTGPRTYDTPLTAFGHTGETLPTSPSPSVSPSLRLPIPCSPRW